MNERVWIAQADTTPVQAPVPLKVVSVVKPGSEQAITIDLGTDQKTKLDLSSIANEKMTMVHVGTKLIILFDNHSTVTIEPFFDSTGKPLADLDVALGGRDVSGQEFASLFPITEDQSVLPAAGNGGTPSSGADFHGSTVEALSTGNPLALLGQENSGGGSEPDAQNPAILQDNAPTLTGAFSAVTVLEADLDTHQDGSDLAAGARTGTDPDASGETATASGVTFKAGSQAMDVVFGDMATAVVKDEAGHTLTITWVVSPNGTHVEGFLPGSDHPAIIIQLGDGTTAGNHTDANGTISPIITITLTDAFPHAGGAADNSIAITGISVVGIDSVPASDGTRQSVSTTIEIHITDDAPVLIGGGEDSPPHVADHAVGEDGLTGANLSDGSYDAVNNAGVSDAALNVDWGADDAIHHALDDTGRELAFNIVGGVPVDGAGHALALTSNGVGLQYVVTELTNGGQQLDAYRGDVHDVQTLIFTVTLDPTSQHGSYSFTLSGNLDHPASGTSGDELPLDFGVTATDSDGDQVATHFTVNVQDDTPTAGEATDTRVNEDDLPNGNDLFKETRTVQGDLAVHWGADNGDARHILIAENGLPTVTSDGVSVVYQTTVDADGNAVVMAYKAGGSASNPSDQVFSLSFNEDGSGTYTFRLLGNIDHAVGSDDKALNFTIDAYDSDGDHVTQSFTVDVADDHAIAIGTILTRSVEEEELPHGNEDTRGANDGDLTVLGFPVDITTAHADGLLNILWGADSANTHANGGFDGTQINGDRSVVFGGTGGAYIGDAAYVADSAHPADADTVSQFLRVTSSGNPVDLATLTSGGVPLEYVLSANGTVLTAYAGATHDNAHAVFEVTLSDTGVGSYNFQLLGVLDHPVHGTSANQEDTLSFNFTFTARDGDGDVAQNNFIVNIIDDSPVAGTGTASKVEDESLPGGNNETETPNLSASVTGVSLNIAWGADDANPTNHGGLGDRSVAFTDSNVVVSGAYNGAVLTSLGQTVSYTVLSDGTLVGYTGSAPSSTASGNVVFYVSLSDQNSGEYNFTLVKPLDQSAGGGENSLSLTFNYTATDSDGDTSNAHFKVTVVDDVPTLDATPIPTRVVEEEQPIVAGPGNEDSSGAGDADHVDFIFPFIHDDTTEKATGSLGVNWGADSANDNNGQPGDRSVQFVNVADPAGLTSRGEAVHYMVTTSGGQQTLVAYTGLSGAPHVVFTVGLSDASAHGTYTFTLKDVLDQHGAGEDTLNLSFQFTATDSDGDTTGIGTFTVGVIDDTPIAVGTIAPRYVEEEALSGGNEDAQPLGVEIAGAIANGGPITDHIGASLNIAWGGDDSNNLGNVGFNGTQADGDRSVVFGGTNGAYVHDTDATHQLTLGDVAQFLSVSGGGVTLATLTSGGEHLVYTLSNNGTVLTASTETSHQAVFTVTLSDAGSGSYNFVLNGVLDHPVHGTSASQEDVLSFNFTFTARDSDGDVAQNNFTVNVIDDSPTITFANIQKGAVDEDALAHGNAGDTYPETSVPLELSGVLPVLPGNKLGTAGDIDATDTAHGSLGVNWGADHGDARTLTFDHASLPTGLTSNHQDVHIWVSSDGTTLMGYTGSVSSSEPTDPVFTVTLDASAPNGAYTFVLHHPLDESVVNQEDSIDLTFGFIATDSDGDTASSHFSVTVNDDAPTASYLGLPTIQESVDTNGHFNTVVYTGTLPFHAGADGATVTDLLYRFSGTPNKVADADAASFTTTPMTSGGLPVTITHDISGGFITLTGATTAGTVFTFKVNQADGSYTYTQSGPLDHPDQGVNGSETGASDGVVLTFDYIVTDSDGDHATDAINLRINDSGPTLAGADTGRVVEEEQPIVAGPGNEDTSGAGDADHVDFIFPFIHDDTTEKATGSLGVNWGADSANDNNGQPGDRSVQFVNVADPAGLTSRGEAVHYMVTTSGGQQTLVAYTGLSGAPHVVFTVGLSDASAHGTYTFTLKDVLDQHGAGEDTLNLSFQFTATDSDGDTTGIGTFTVGVIDDTPIAVGTIAPRYVEEEALSGGNEDAQPLGVEIAGAIANGGPITDHIGASLNIAWGGDDSNNLGNVGFNGTQADGDRSVVFGGTNGAYVHDTDATHQLTLGDVAQFLSVSGGGVTLATLTSGGEHLVYTLSNNGTVLTASTETSHQAVFTVTLSDAGSGSYNFVLNGVLDHPVHGTSASQEDVLSFNFTFTAHDSDGDVAQNNFTVNVIDDSPIIGAGMSKATIDEDGLLKARGDQVNGNNDSQPGDVTVPNSDNDANEATATGTLNIKWGADNHDIDDTYTNASGFKQDGEGRSVTFTNTNVGIAGAADLTGAHLSSHGDQIVFSLTDNDTRLVGIATRNGFERTVIEVTLSDDGTGAYHVILHDALDQALGNNENNITLTFNYTASDADGDTAHGSFQVVVNDDVPVFTGQTATSSVNEGDMFTLTTVSSHTLNFSSTGLSATHLHAGGGAGVGVVSYGGNSNLQGPDQNPGAKTLILTADSGTTFTLGSVALGLFGTSGGSMTVTLKGYDADNHLVATATFDAQSVGGNPAAVITSIFNSASSDPNHAFLNVQISTLEIIPPPGYAGRVVIDNLGVTETTTTITSTPHAVDTVVDLTSLVSMGADSPGTWSVAPFSAQQVHFTQGTSVDPATYNGTPIMLSSSDGHTIVAMAGTEVIFTLTVSASGQATFELLKPIDGGTLRSIDFSQLITVTDSDGDPLTLASGDFVIDINSMNHLPTVSAAAISVNEAGLPDGSNHGDGSNTNTGTIVLNPGDGPSHVTIDNVLVTHTGQEFESSLGTLTITSITATAIGYSYVLHTTTSGTGTDDTFSIVVTDSDHDTQSTTLTINIGDDGPSAKADTDGTVEGRTLHVAVADGVLHNDVSGADGYNATGAVVGVRVADSDLTTAASGHVGTALTGHYGTLTLNTDGSYDYKSDPNLVPSEGATETFVYTIEDGDGSLSTTTLKIALTDSTPHPVGVEKTVDEAGLTDGSAPSAPATKATGDLVLGDTDTPHVTHILGANGESDITGTTVSVNGLYGTLTLDQSGHYTYTLTSPFHTTPGNNDGANVETGKDVFTYTVTDAYGNTNTSSISIDIKDDVPVANFVSATMGENDDKTVALHAGTDFIYGADGAGTLTLGAISVTGAYTPADLSGLDISLNGTDIVIKPGTTFDPLNAGQSSTIHIQYAVTDSDGDIKTNEVTVQVNGVTDNQSPTVNGETIFVDYDASREAAPSWYDPNGSKYAFSIPTLALLWNDSDPDHDVLSITSVSGSGATLSADGQYVLFPTNASGSFHYTVFDGVNHVDAIATINLVADASGKATSGADFLIDNSQVGPNFVGGAGGDILVENSLNGGNLFGDSQFNPDNLSSGSGNDLLIGSDTQGDNIYGGKGDDTLWGRGGADTMFGDVGNDTLIGGAGADKMTGGAGADHFRYTALTDGGTVASGDHIVDFSGHDGQGDVIDLLSSVFGGGLGAIANVDLVQVANGMNLTATAGPTAVDMGSAHFAYQQSSGQLFYDSDGGGAANRVLIAILENNAAVQATDIHKVAG